MKSDRDNIVSLAEALYLYLQEVGGYRKICMQHDFSTQTISARNNTLWLRKYYRNNYDLLAHVERAIANLEGWEHSIFNHTIANWEEAAKRIGRERNVRFCRGISWRGLPILVTVHAIDKRIRVSTGQIATDDLVDSFSLSRIARGLELHESLVPKEIWEPMSTFENRNGDFPIRAYLRRTMPDDLMATKCLEYWPSNKHLPTSAPSPLSAEV